jgi:hypothetical protein
MVQNKCLNRVIKYKNMSKSKSQQIAEKTIFAAFKILKDAGGEMRGKDAIDKIRETVTFDEYESHPALQILLTMK